MFFNSFEYYSQKKSSVTSFDNRNEILIIFCIIGITCVRIAYSLYIQWNKNDGDTQEKITSNENKKTERENQKRNEFVM